VDNQSPLSNDPTVLCVNEVQIGEVRLPVSFPGDFHPDASVQQE